MMRSVTIRLLRPQQPLLRQFSTLSRSRLLCLPKLATPPLRQQAAAFTTSAFRSMDPKLISKEVLEKEHEINQLKKLKSDPAHVSSTSTTTPILDTGSSSTPQEGDEPDMLADLKSDLRTVKETFALTEVPKEVYIFGIGGLVPYIVTSATTLALAWDLNQTTAYGSPYLVSHSTAQHLLEILEPVQVGLGAIILSFLGAIHWGLEFAQYGGTHPLRRYGIGILAPALAWPTVLLPLDYALLTQFVGFTMMYFADANATTMGWMPKWYTTYRFILTFVVGACIVITLIGRGQIGDNVTPTQRAETQLAELRAVQKRNRDTDADKPHVTTGGDRRTEEGQHEAQNEGKAVKGDRGASPNVHKDDTTDSADVKKDQKEDEPRGKKQSKKDSEAPSKKEDAQPEGKGETKKED